MQAEWIKKPPCPYTLQHFCDDNGYFRSSFARILSILCVTAAQLIPSLSEKYPDYFSCTFAKYSEMILRTLESHCENLSNLFFVPIKKTASVDRSSPWYVFTVQ